MNEYFKYALAASLLNHWQTSQEAVNIGRVKKLASVSKKLDKVLELPSPMCRTFIYSLVNTTKRRHARNIRFLLYNDQSLAQNNIKCHAVILRSKIHITVSILNGYTWREKYYEIKPAILNIDDTLQETISWFDIPRDGIILTREYKYIEKGMIIETASITKKIKKFISQVKRAVSLVNFIRNHESYILNSERIKRREIQLSLINPEFIDDIFTCKDIKFEETAKAKKQKLALEKLKDLKTKAKPGMATTNLFLSDVHRLQEEF